MTSQLTGPERALPEATVGDLFARHATTAPEAIALVSEGRSVRYRDLDAAARQIAADLTAAGVRPGDTVAVLTARSSRLLASMLAVWKVGGIYLPIDAGHPTERISFILDDAHAVVTVHDAGPGDADVRVRAIIGGAGPHGSRPEPGAGAGAAYVIYTSGSTGSPKGVRVGHRSLLNVVLELADAMACGPEDTWLMMAPAMFDISMAEFCVPLVTGARLVVTSERDLRDANVLVRSIREHRVTRMQAVPSQWRALLDAGFDAPGMIAMVGGEALPVKLAHSLRDRVGGLFNGYGPTETTVLSTLWPVPIRTREVTIGAPIANTRIYVLDDNRRPVAIGEPGELYIAGTGVSEGYPGRPDLTGQLFVPDPDGPAGSRMYRTGDRVRCRVDGLVEFLGRDDGQVKVRGQRVELGEVEARLADHPEVAGVAALVHEDSLVAYVVLASKDAVSPTALREYAGLILPPPMVPNIFVMLDRFPLTPNGKIDKSALPAPARTPDRSPIGAAQGRPDDPDHVSAVLCEICREVLGLPVVSPEDDLFALGAHSLLLMQIIARLDAVLGVTIPVEVLYDAERISDVAAAVARQPR